MLMGLGRDDVKKKGRSSWSMANGSHLSQSVGDLPLIFQSQGNGTIRRNNWKHDFIKFRHLKLTLPFYYFVSIILDKPENTQLTVNAANTSSVPFGSKITFVCTSNSHPVVHEYILYRFQELLGYSRTGIFSFNINKTGLYSCIPFNVVGSGERAALTVVVDGRSLCLLR